MYAMLPSYVITVHVWLTNYANIQYIYLKCGWLPTLKGGGSNSLD